MRTPAGPFGRGYRAPRHDRVRSNRDRYHQQYLADTKNPYGYCPDHGTGVSCPIGVVRASGPLGGVKADC